MEESIRDGEGPEVIRNVSIIGHPAAGVTELARKVLAEDETPVRPILRDPEGWWILVDG